MHALDVEPDATGGQIAPEAADSGVLTPSAAEREAHGRVVDLEHRARVVAELTHEPKVEDHPVSHAAALELRMQRAQALDGVRHGAVRSLEHVRPAAQLGQPEQQLTLTLR